ncbi:hypothetical protein C8R47DRAFT_1218694 [Mycena vitilis]|nr:hypothetical protein C8R47DRAFT_1218694 [Mycena vitilis]
MSVEEVPLSLLSLLVFAMGSDCLRSPEGVRHCDGFIVWHELLNDYHRRSNLPALAAVKDAVSISLQGSVHQDKETGLPASGLALYSILANNTIPTNPVFRTDTPQLIEQLLTNTMISLIAHNLWTASVSADVVRSANMFVYEPHALWAGYDAAIGVTILAMAVGLHALWLNGGGGGKAFSLIVATTRNPALEAVTTRALHEKDYRETYSKLKFRYTNMGEEGGVDRLAFREW